MIYIDGSHQREDVLADSSLAWKLLKQDGFMIWDDYKWEGYAPLANHPKQAIDCFLMLHRGDISLVHIGQQAIVQKRPSPEARDMPGWVFPRTPQNLLRFLRKEPIGSFRVF